jgi:pimeloyl-ACP methyl ester carboxylesterase
MSRTDTTLVSNHTLQLHDGRMLGYAEYGPGEGTPLFYFHGYPGARLEAGFLAKAAAQAGLRLIGVDRPGMGLSSFQAGRHLLDWPEDVAALAEHLAIDRFAVVGFSGGGPYALACAYKMPERLTTCGIVAGMGPLEYGTVGMMARNRLLFFLARRFPWVLSPLMWAMGRSCREEEQARTSLRRSAPQMVEPDRVCVLDPESGGLLAADMVEAFRQGARGPAYEGTLYGRSWDFRIEDIAFPALFLWHGACDRNVPLAMGRAVADKLAHCQATYYADEGHLSLVVNHAAEIVTSLSS